MIRRIVTYGFPLIFILAEHLLRLILSSDPRGFIAPTLASVGIGQLLPLVVLKDKSKLLPKTVRAALKGNVLVSKWDEIVVQVSWVLIFVFTLVWAVLVYLSIRAADSEALLFGYKTFYFGILTYFIGVILAEMKEWV